MWGGSCRHNMNYHRALLWGTLFPDRLEQMPFELQFSLHKWTSNAVEVPTMTILIGWEVFCTVEQTNSPNMQTNICNKTHHCLFRVGMEIGEVCSPQCGRWRAFSPGRWSSHFSKSTFFQKVLFLSLKAWSFETEEEFMFPQMEICKVLQNVTKEEFSVKASKVCIGISLCQKLVKKLNIDEITHFSRLVWRNTQVGCSNFWELRCRHNRRRDNFTINIFHQLRNQ